MKTLNLYLVLISGLLLSACADNILAAPKTITNLYATPNDAVVVLARGFETSFGNSQYYDMTFKKAPIRAESPSFSLRFPKTGYGPYAFKVEPGTYYLTNVSINHAWKGAVPDNSYAEFTVAAGETVYLGYALLGTDKSVYKNSQKHASTDIFGRMISSATNQAKSAFTSRDVALSIKNNCEADVQKFKTRYTGYPENISCRPLTIGPLARRY